MVTFSGGFLFWQDPGGIRTDMRNMLQVPRTTCMHACMRSQTGANMPRPLYAFTHRIWLIKFPPWCLRGWRVEERYLSATIGQCAR